MKPLFFVVLIVLLAFNSTFLQASSAVMPLSEELPEYSKVYNDKRDPFADAVAAISLAEKTNRNVLIEIGGNWCTWCKRMDSFLEDNPKVYQSLHSKFVVLKVNVSDSNENDDFMKSLPPVLGYPHMYVSTSAGKILLSKDTLELQENGDYSVDNWLMFLDKWQVSSATITNGKTNVSD